MPHKNTVRRYYERGCYHIYNRGVEKRTIFKNNQDYRTFISLLESYLTPKEDVLSKIKNRNKSETPWRSKLQKDEIELICYCLMPNHFHLLIKQNSKNGVTRFMRRVSTSYVSYFNKKYNRQGTLFQGKFKAISIEKDFYFLHLSRYIHLNPLEVGPLKNKLKWLEKYPYSSYTDYLGKRKIKWLHKKSVINLFKSELSRYSSYKIFVQDCKQNTPKTIKDLILE